jgi:hypothetical protein
VQAVGTTSAPKTVTVKNVSAVTVPIGFILGAGEFSVAVGGTRPCVAGLKPNTSCTFTASFSPVFGTNGPVNGTVTIYDDAAVNQQIVEAKGTAALPLSFAPATLKFAPQNVGTSSTAQTVVLTNNLAIAISPTITGNGDYAAAAGGPTPCAGALAAHTKCTFRVTFTPSAVGTRGGAITVTDSANPGTQIVSLSGTGQ